MRLATIATTVILVFSLSACTNKAMKYYNKGLLKYDREEYSFAIENFQQALKHGAPEESVSYYIAEAYRLSNRLPEAEEHYKKAIEQGSSDEHALFYYAYALKANGKYKTAQKQFKKFLSVGENYDYLARAKHEIKNLKKLQKILQKPTSFTVENCEGLNTEAIEYSPVIFKDKFYFTSSRGEGTMFTGQGTRFTDLFEFKFDKISKYSGVAKKLPLTINKENVHEASCTFSPDGKTVIFARSNDGKLNSITKHVDLYESKYVDGQWTEAQRLQLNDTDAWDSNPCLSSDGKTLYFSSSREGGYGALDLYQAKMQEDGTWGEVENLGPKVNSQGEDSFPMVSPNGTLYFSSNGHVGFGELDLFVVRYDKKGKPRVENLGTPINSSYDDFAITFIENEIGFFTSNRPDGKGDDDIYSFKVSIKQYLDIVIKGKVIDSVHNVVTENLKLLPGATITIHDTTTNTDIGTFTADAHAKVRIPINPEKYYGLAAIKQQFFVNSKLYSTMGKTPTALQVKKHKNLYYKTEIILEPKVKDLKIELDPIYYPYDQWVITDSAANVLDSLVTIMNANPDLLIELGSHTDARNTHKYNDLLSQRRAESAVVYILSKGIDKHRIFPKGYGERIPLKLNRDFGSFKKGTVFDHVFIESLSNNDDKELAHQLNRRTEFTIVEEILRH